MQQSLTGLYQATFSAAAAATKTLAEIPLPFGFVRGELLVREITAPTPQTGLLFASTSGILVRNAAPPTPQSTIFTFGSVPAYVPGIGLYVSALSWAALDPATGARAAWESVLATSAGGAAASPLFQFPVPRFETGQASIQIVLVRDATVGTGLYEATIALYSLGAPGPTQATVIAAA